MRPFPCRYRLLQTRLHIVRPPLTGFICFHMTAFSLTVHAHALGGHQRAFGETDPSGQQPDSLSGTHTRRVRANERVWSAAPPPGEGSAHAREGFLKSPFLWSVDRKQLRTLETCTYWEYLFYWLICSTPTSPATTPAMIITSRS